jgi:hypothetical protein
MERKSPRTSLALLFAAMTAACVVAAVWAESPVEGEYNPLVTATAIAFVAALFIPHGTQVGPLFGRGS